MAELLIALDLADPHQGKACIVDSLMRLGEAWARPLETVWVVRTERSAAAVEAELSQCLGPDDGLLVQPIAEQGALVNASLRWFRRRVDVDAAERAERATGHAPGREGGVRAPSNVVTLRVAPSPWLQVARENAVRAAS
ncbi:MAG TPA: hypothetical protein PK264_05530 [Hyphomicrobiaceae bacterium]|nr:hypothetical protein [Hyphomicrobiaceae bacterium]